MSVITVSVDEAAPSRGAVRALAVASTATLLALMNYNSTFSTLSVMARDLHAGTAAQTWFLSSGALGLAVLLLITGSLADDYGRKRVFVCGAAGFALASVVCAAAPGTPVFVAGRIAQGGASAALLAAGLGLIGSVFPAGPQRARATGVWGAMVGGGVALGPVASAGMAALAGWRSWYWAAAAAAVLLAAIAVASLPESRAERPRRPDLAGVVTSGLGLAALLGGLTQGRGGWGRPAVLVLFAVAAVLLGAFVVIEARTREPMLDLGLFRRPGFVVSTTGAFFTGFAAVGMMSYLPTVADRALGEPPLAAGATLTLWAGVSFAVALCARRLGVRVQARHQVAAGLLLTATGHLAMLGLTEHTGWWRLAPGLVVAGAGVGLLNAALARLAVESAPAGRAGMGSGAGNTARYIGGSMGVAVVVAIATTTGSGNPAHALAHGANVALAVTAAVAVAGAVMALAIRSDED